MTDLPPSYAVVPASSLSGTVTITEPLPDSQVRDLLQAWVSRQDRFWPCELAADVLARSLQCVYVAHWVLHAQASGAWAASIGVRHERYEICPSCKGKRGRWGKDIYGEATFYDCSRCGGKGQIKKDFLVWNSQSGVANASLNGRVIENVANDVNIRCGKRDLEATEGRLSPPFPSDVLVLQPDSTGDGAGRHIAESIVRSGVKQDARRTASGLGRVRDLRVAHARVEDIRVRTWLYPFLVGTYQFDEAVHHIQIDGVTGSMRIEVPKSVRNERILHALKIVAIVISVLAVAYGIWWLATRL